MLRLEGVNTMRETRTLEFRETITNTFLNNCASHSRYFSELHIHLSIHLSVNCIFELIRAYLLKFIKLQKHLF